MRAILAALLLLLLALPASADALLEPNPAFSPKKVVQLQLAALQDNDSPNENQGIRQAWAFAHPDNKAQTGPLERFTAMIQGPHYSPLIDHARHEIERLDRREEMARFAVTVTDTQGRALKYLWTVAKVTDGAHAGTWMTVSVSPPQDAGEPI